MQKLLCYELNEVPWRVIDHYIEHRPDSRLASLLGRSATFTSHSNDRGELQPWSTWPTVHRGVSNEVHHIDFLNQDLSAADPWPPVWKILTEAGIDCGIFGSLQSYPPVRHPHMRFHVPDTFAAGPETIPAKYAAFQAFNLAQTGANKAVASSVSVTDVPKAAIGMLRSGIGLGTGAKIARHLVAERRDALHKTRRSLLQPELALDVFLDCLERDQPAFVTFFSNHVAGIMHRYWKYTFPEDFDHVPDGSARERFHAESLIRAMDIFDDHLARLEPVLRRHDYRLLIVSSMGQEAIDRGEYVAELGLDDLATLLGGLGIDYPVRMNLAMQPDLAFEFDDRASLDDFRARLGQVTSTAGEPLFRQLYAEVGLTLNMALCSSPSLAANATALVDDRSVPLAALGLELIERDQGTAYHQPEGILVWEGFDTTLAPRATIDSRRLLPTLLAHYGVDRADYLQPPIERRAATPDDAPSANAASEGRAA